MGWAVINGCITDPGCDCPDVERPGPGRYTLSSASLSPITPSGESFDLDAEGLELEVSPDRSTLWLRFTIAGDTVVERWRLVSQ